MRFICTAILFMIYLMTSVHGIYAADPVQKGSMQINLELTDPGGTDTVTEIVKLRHINASEIEPFIKARMSQYGAVQVNDAMNMLVISDIDKKLRDLVKTVKKLDTPGLKDFMHLETAIIPVVNLQASQLVNLIQERLSSDGIIKTDDNLNSVIVTDLKSKIRQVKDLIKKLDLPIRQVMIEVKILEINNGDESQLGIDWRTILQSAQATANVISQKNEFPSHIKTNTVLDGNDAIENLVDVSQNLSPIGRSFKSNMSIQGLDSVLGLLISDGKAKILSSPRIVGSNNRRAYITDGEKIYYSTDRRDYYNNDHSRINNNNNTTVYESGYSADYTRIDSSAEILNNLNTTRYTSEGSVNAGFSLNVVPHILSDELVTLEVDATINNLTGWSPTGAPIISSRAANSTVTVKSGEVFVMGGLKKDAIVKTVDRFPILGYIPILDYIFASHKESKVSNDVVLFIVPTVLEKIGENSDNNDLKILNKLEQKITKDRKNLKK